MGTFAGPRGALGPWGCSCGAATVDGLRDITITTGLVDTYSTPTLLKLIAAQLIDPRQFVTHHFHMDEFLAAYDIFARASETGALKVVVER